MKYYFWLSLNILTVILHGKNLSPYVSSTKQVRQSTESCECNRKQAS